ncbi:hypothetical protein BX600DRAFT_190882 [Xylariales sp. PMI_506]|nr:hypothetical protein BX600DRAFT_190882 [Xylariales sp. PMI_506]
MSNPLPPKQQGLRYTFSVRPRAAATRATAPKVRTGCKTCKQRHVKCDEGKPSCARCIKWRGVCDGYDQANSSKKPQTETPDDPHPVILRRKLQALDYWKPQLVNSAKQGGLAMVMNMKHTPFKNQNEHDYFESWIKMAPTVTNDSTSNIYTTLITQFGWEDQAVREAIMAVGALKFSSKQPSRRNGSSDNQQHDHYTNALARYGTALKLTASRTIDEASLRSVLLCCILFVCFELLDRNRASVHNHIYHGTQVLRQFLRSSLLRTQLNQCAASPSPYVIDDAVIQIFQKFSMMSWSQLALQPSQPQATLPGGSSLPKNPVPPPPLPTSFRDLEDASRWLDMLQKCIIDNMRSCLHRLTSDRHLAGQGLDIGEEPGWLGIRVACLAATSQWLSLFKPLRAEADSQKQENPLKHAQHTALYVQARFTYGAIYSHHFRDYKSLMEITPIFREVVQLLHLIPVRVVEDTLEGELTLNGPLFCLFCCVTKCRDADVRAEAEKLLRQRHELEGLWDGGAALAICEWVKQLEAEYYEDLADHELVWRKLRNRSVRFHNHKNIAWAKAERLDRATGEWYLREDVIRW